MNTVGNVAKGIGRGVRNFFVPHHSNNYKPHALGHRSLSVYAGMMISLKLLTLFSLDMLPENKAFSSAVTPDNILQLTNFSREAFGLADLKMNPLLSDAAQAKANDMLQNQYFAHVSPSGLTPWSFIKAQGYNYIVAGENLAVNFYSSEAVENAWMNSPGHKANILNKDFQDIGIGVVQGTYKNSKAIFVVQMFGSSIDQPYATNLSFSNLKQQVAQAPQIIVPTPKQISLSAPVIENPQFNLTDNKNFVIRGYIQGATAAYVLVNHIPVAKLDVVEGHFSGIVPLSEGTNSVNVVGFDNLNASPISKIITVQLDSVAPEFTSSVQPFIENGNTYYKVEVQTQGDAVKVLANLGDQNIMLQPTAQNNVWQGTIAADPNIQGHLNLTAYDLAGNSRITGAATISKSIVDTFGFNAVKDFKVSVMGNDLSLKDVNRFYAYALLFLLAGLGVIIGVKRHVQHVGLIAHTSAMIMLAALFLIT